jgi:hypothetical protein
MKETDRLSSATRILAGASAFAFSLLGMVLFATPTWSAERFSWDVSPFVTMTIGGWCLGTAVMGWIAVRDSKWGNVYPVLLYLWSFAALELGVLIWFRDALRLDVALAWPYIGTLLLGLVAAVFGLADVVRSRPPLGEVSFVPWWTRVLVIVFVVFVGFLAVVAAAKSEGAPEQSVFPEPLSPFTVRAFGAFYLSLGIGAVPLIWARSMRPALAYMWGGLALLIPITAAALVYLDRFDFGAHPRQALYLGAYGVASIVVLLVGLWARGRARSPSAK